jgi:hypothetical protein
VVARRQLAALGVSRHTVDHWLRAGRLPRVSQAVYAVGHTALRAEGRRLAAVLACGPGRCSRIGAIARANGHRGTQVLARATSRTPKWTQNE